MTVRSHLRAQARACARLGSPFTARLLDIVADCLDEAGGVGRTILNWRGDPKADALALRLAGSLHALALSGTAASLAAAYPGGARGDEPAALRAAVVSSLEAHSGFILTFLERPPQTNEVARAAVLLGGFLTIAAETRLPLRLCEIGASAGLNLHWHTYGYDLGKASWGCPDAPLRLTPAWRGALPPLIPVEVRSHRGCDRMPIDPSDPGDRLRVLAYKTSPNAGTGSGPRLILRRAPGCGSSRPMPPTGSRRAWPIQRLARRPFCFIRLSGSICQRTSNAASKRPFDALVTRLRPTVLLPGCAWSPHRTAARPSFG
jgi:hypothetical protein